MSVPGLPTTYHSIYYEATPNAMHDSPLQKMTAPGGIPSENRPPGVADKILSAADKICCRNLLQISSPWKPV